MFGLLDYMNDSTRTNIRVRVDILVVQQSVYSRLEAMFARINQENRNSETPPKRKGTRSKSKQKKVCCTNFQCHASVLNASSVSQLYVFYLQFPKLREFPETKSSKEENHPQHGIIRGDQEEDQHHHHQEEQEGARRRGAE